MSEKLFYPISVPNLNGREKEYLADCIDSTYVSTMGNYLNQFECSLADFDDAYCALTNSGTSALHLGLLESGVSENDLVILPNLTFIATSNALSYIGATPVLIDCDLDNLNIDLTKLEVFLKEECKTSVTGTVHKLTGKKIACILPVCVFGNILDFEKLREISQKYKVPTLLDAAGALGARYKGEPLTKFVDALIYSFNGNKVITSGGGGALLSKDKNKIDHAKFLCSTARPTGEYLHQEVGYNYRMTNIEAALGLAQFEQLKVFISKKKEMFKFYQSIAHDFSFVEAFPTIAERGGNYWLSGLILSGLEKNEIDIFHRELRAKGIDARGFWHPLSLQPCVKNSIKTDLTNSLNIWNKLLPLPCSTNLSSIDKENIDKVVREALCLISEKR